MANNEDTVVEATENTPLLPQKPSEPPKWGKSVLYRALFCSFLVSMSFGVTQVPLIYVFRLMTCEAYYHNHPEPASPRGRCDNHAIEAGTAKAVALLGASTTLFGIVNLFITGWSIKKIGVKAALLIQVFWPAARLTIQNIGVETGGATGIIIVQCSQIITIVGGPSGYILSLNSYIAEISEHKERTGALGRLQGCTMFGTAVGFLAGGIIGDKFGIIWPFRVTLGLFVLSCCYVFLFLPWIPLNKAEQARTVRGIRRLFGPFRIFIPQKWIHPGGSVHTEYGALLLGIGVYLGVLATGYIPVLLQMYSTDEFGFGTTENGNLIFLYALLRGLFLMFAFPRIINIGRAWMKQRNKTHSINENGKPAEDDAIPDLPVEPEDLNTTEAIENEQEPIEPPKLHDEKETFAFDLFYSKFSLILDGILTLGASFVTKGWQIYLVAAFLPFAAGTGAAAKGTILQMCLSSERTDALSAITLIENLARLSTTMMFGLVFAGFATVGKTYLVFTVNAAVALFGFVFLLFSRFPPDGSERLDEEQLHDPPSTSE